MQTGPGTITTEQDEEKINEALRQELTEIARELCDSDDGDEKAAGRELADELKDDEIGHERLEELLNENAPVFCKYGDTDDGVGFVVDDESVDDAVGEKEIVKLGDDDEVEGAEDIEPDQFYGVFDPQDGLVALYDHERQLIWEV